jgi:hypothetical protein
MNCEDETERSPPCNGPPEEHRPYPPPPPPPPPAEHPDGRCKRLAAELNKELHGLSQLFNHMKPQDEAFQEFTSSTVDIPRFQPWVSISWGDSKCDCIESDDTEIMYLTICNPYSNLTLANVTVQEVLVVDDSGQSVPKLPNGDRCIQLVPVGPYFFDDIPPKTCVSRQFLVRLRGAPGGKHRIMVNAICFDACVHGDNNTWFSFDVCKD